MNKHYAFIICTILLVLCSYQCFAAEKDWTELRRIAQADPAKDFSKSIENKDYRFVGVYGYSLEIPGVSNYQKEYSKKFGVRVIPGTSDVIANEEHRQLIKKARQYATEYNKLLLRWIRKRPGK